MPSEVAFDGRFIWVTNVFSNDVSKLRATVGTFPVGPNPESLAFDGANIWVTNSNDGTVAKR